MSKQNKPGRPKFNPVIPKGNFTMKQFCEANGVDVSGTPKTNKNWGKGESCIRLTLVHWLARERKNRKTGLVTRLDQSAKVPADGGLGAPQWVFCARNETDCGVAAAKARRAEAQANRATPTKVSTSHKARTVKVVSITKPKRKYTRKTAVAPVVTAETAVAPEAPVSAGDATSSMTKMYEAIKGELAKPEPITAPVTVPVAEIATPAPEPVPVAETPEPVTAPVTETPAPVAA